MLPWETLESLGIDLARKGGKSYTLQVDDPFSSIAAVSRREFAQSEQHRYTSDRLVASPFRSRHGFYKRHRIWQRQSRVLPKCIEPGSGVPDCSTDCNLIA